MTTVAAAAARKALWRGMFAGAGGMRVRGQLPRGGCVVVANHCSHADAPALVAALPARSRPAVAAAADYWFNGSRRAWVCRTLVGGFGVRRTGGGSADLQAAVSLLRQGRSVVVLPEGTRSRNGRLGEFHAGAFRLAAAAGVPVVPVGLVGTSAVMPVHGRPHRGPVEVRVGEPLVAAEPGLARAAVVELLEHPAEPIDSRFGAAVRRLALSRTGLLVVFVWALLEAISWPFVPEVLIGTLLLARVPWHRALVLIAVASVGSVVGCAVTYELARLVGTPIAPLTTTRMHATAAAELSAEGAPGVRHQAWSGIPVKVYAAAAGQQDVPLRPFLTEVAVTRALRIATVALFVGSLAQMVSRRLFPVALATALAFFGIGLARVIAHWS